MYNAESPLKRGRQWIFEANQIVDKNKNKKERKRERRKWQWDEEFQVKKKKERGEDGAERKIETKKRDFEKSSFQQFLSDNYIFNFILPKGFIHI